MKKKYLDLSKVIRAEQSSRTTFKLSDIANQALDDLCKTFSLTPKNILKVIFAYQSITDDAIEQAKKSQNLNGIKLTRKTIVISKDMHLSLNRISRDNKVSRDDLLNALLINFKEFFKHQIEEEKEMVKKAKNVIADFNKYLSQVENNLRSLLPEDHPITIRFGVVAIITENLISAIDNKLEKNIPIDPDDFSQSC
jgi:hypothetical protein